MSGLEPMAALGLACNVFQAISFTMEVCVVAKDVFEIGESPNSNALLSTSMANLTATMDHIKSSTDSASLSPIDKRIVQLAEDCTKVANELKADIDKSTGSASSSAKGHSFRSVRVAISSVVRSRSKKVAKLEQRLQTYQNTLETELLVKICSKADAAEATRQTEFGKLDSTLQEFIKKIAEGGTRMAALLTQELELVKELVVNETGALGTAVNDLSQLILQHGRDFKDLDGTISNQYRLEQQDRMRERLLGSLKYPGMNRRRNQIRDRHPETFEWLFPGSLELVGGKETDVEGYYDTNYYDEVREDRARDAGAKFCSWLESPSSEALFWISGKPGSGKSTLVKFLVEDQRTMDHMAMAGIQEQDIIILAHFIWSAGQAMEASVKGLLCSLIHQLLLEDGQMIERVTGRFRGIHVLTKNEYFDWSEKELKTVLLFLLREVANGRSFCIFIDGLDEIKPSEDQLHSLLGLTEELRNIPNVKLCVSSRPDPILKDYLANFPTFRMQDLTHRDIFNFTYSTISKRLQDSNTKLEADYILTLVDQLSDKADGVFLWVALASRNLVHGLQKGDGFRELEQRLKSLPAELRTLYRDMWDRLGEEKDIYKQDAAKYLKYICLIIGKQSDSDYYSKLHDSFNPLQLLLATNSDLSDRVLALDAQPSLSKEEVQELSRNMVRRLEVRCFGLLDVSASAYDRPIKFVHRSAKEFLETDQDGQVLLAIDESTVQDLVFTLLKGCIAQAFLFQQGKTSKCLKKINWPSTMASLIMDLWLEEKRIDLHQALELMLWSRPLYLPYRQEDIFGVQTAHRMRDLLGEAVYQGFWEFLDISLDSTDRRNRGFKCGPISAPYMSFLLSMAINSSYKRSLRWYLERPHKVVCWLSQKDIDPHFGICPHSSANDDYHVPETPLTGLVSLLLRTPRDTLSEQVDTLVETLECLMRAGANLSNECIVHMVVDRSVRGGGYSSPFSTLLLVPMPTFVPKYGDFVYNGVRPSIIYIEVEIRLILDIVLNRFIKIGMSDTPGVQKLMATLVTPGRGSPVKRVLVEGQITREEFEEKMNDDWVTIPNRHRPSLWRTTEDPGLLRKVGRYLRKESPQPDDPWTPDDLVFDYKEEFELTFPLLQPYDVIVKDAQTLGTPISWDDICKDWLARDFIFEKDDPRLLPPKAWD